MPPMTTAVFSSPIVSKAMNAVVKVAVNFQVNGIAGLRALESDFFVTPEDSLEVNIFFD